MKHRTPFILSTMFFLALFATAGRQAPAPNPTLIVSCTVCQAGDAITFYGSGYKAKTQVEIDIHGPVSYTIKTIVDGKGNISVDYGTVLSYDPGSYSVSASAISGKSLTLLVTTSFTVE